MAEQQTELEQQFEKLHQLIQQNQHAKIVKLTDTSKHVLHREQSLDFLLKVQCN